MPYFNVDYVLNLFITAFFTSLVGDLFALLWWILGPYVLPHTAYGAVSPLLEDLKRLLDQTSACNMTTKLGDFTSAGHVQDLAQKYLEWVSRLSLIYLTCLLTFR